MNHMKNQISALNDPFPSFDEHHWFDGHEFGWTQGVGDGQGGLACCNSWGRKESDTTERLNWTELNVINYIICNLLVSQDYYFLYYQVYDWASTENNDD